VIFINNDTEVQPGWLDSLLDPFDDPEVMGTQPKLLYPDGRVQCVGVVFSGKTPLGYPIYVDEVSDSPLVAQNRRFRAITGAGFAMRAADFAAVGGFDPVFINGQEDVDLCYRLGQGRDVFEYVAASVVTHHEGRTKGRGRFINHNRHTFVRRWRDAFPGNDADYYAKDGYVVSEYLSDRHELDEADIACWRARTETKSKTV
jgi:GT2 family glycosyltransferase